MRRKKDENKSLQEFLECIHYFPEVNWEECDLLSVYDDDDEEDYAVTEEVRYFVGGKNFMRESYYDLAIDAFTKAIELNPGFTQAYDFRGMAYASMYQYDKSIADFDMALQTDAEYYPAYNNRGLSFFKKCMFERALVDYNRAIRLNPDVAIILTITSY